MNDIFADPALPRAFYHPSPNKDVNRYKSGARLSPDRMAQDDDNLEESYLDNEFISGGHTYKKRLPTTKDLEKGGTPGDISSKFDESWPVSERPSTVSIPELEDSQFTVNGMHVKSLNMKHGKGPGQSSRKGFTFEYPERDIPIKQSGKDTKATTAPSSTLAKYIERFRHGQPMSREEREHQLQNGPTDDFWWLNKTTPSDMSTPKDDSENGGRTKKWTPQDEDKENMKTHMSLGDYMRSGKGSLLDDNLRSLQEKADRLLERTGSSLNSSEPIVSTDGLGSTTGSSLATPRTVEEQPYQPGFIKKKNMEIYSKPLNPEDDILMQWRRKRKVELMKSNDPILGRSAKAADHELESKLATFRKRLDATLKGATVGEMTNITQTATDSIETARLRERLSKTQPVNAVPSNRVLFTPAPHISQVNTECQTSPCQSPRRGERENQQVQTITTTSKHHHSSPIASPNLPRKIISITSSERASARSVEPHMHLSCDIIPCPLTHSHDYHNNESESENNYKRDSKHSKKTSNNTQNQNSNNSHGRISSRNRKTATYPQSKGEDDEHLPHSYDDSDSSFERMKIKHLKLLKKEESLKKVVTQHGSSSGIRGPSKKKVAVVRSFDSETEGSEQDFVMQERQRPSKDKQIPNKSSTRQTSERNVQGASKSKYGANIRRKSVRSEITDENISGHQQFQDSDRSHRTKQSSHDLLQKEDLNSFTDVTELDPSKLNVRKHSSQSNFDDTITKQDQIGETLKPKSKTRRNQTESTIQSSTESKSNLNDKSQDVVDKKFAKQNLKPKLSKNTPSRSALPLSKSSSIPPPKQSMEEPDFGALKGRSDRKLGRRSLKSGQQPLHSSPMPSINSAIGQVVGEHLFVSSVSFASSVDSFQPSQMNATVTTIPEVPEGTDPSQGDLNLDEELLSDGEEFPEDEILLDLRKRRNQFLQQLLDIDALLEGKTDEK